MLGLEHQQHWTIFASQLEYPEGKEQWGGSWKQHGHTIFQLLPSSDDVYYFPAPWSWLASWLILTHGTQQEWQCVCVPQLETPKPCRFPLSPLWTLLLPCKETWDRWLNNERPHGKEGLPTTQHHRPQHRSEARLNSPASGRQDIRWPQLPEWIHPRPENCPAKPTHNVES